MILDVLMTKSLTTSGTGSQFPLGPITAGGSGVDEFDMGLLVGDEPLWFWINVTGSSGTSPAMTPTLVSDDNVAFSSTALLWTCPDSIVATSGLKVYKIGKCRERYVRLETGTIGGSATPVLTFSCGFTIHPPSGLL